MTATVSPPRRTVEEMETLQRLGRIFSPHATRAIGQTFDRQGVKPEVGSYLRFAHYTTAEAALNILRTKTLYMRNTSAMADFREVQHGYNLISRALTPERTQAFSTAFDKIYPGVSQEAIQSFNSWWAANNFLNIYVTSFSEHAKEEDIHGRLSMWRAFGTNASARVALILKFPYGARVGDALGVIFSPVAYLTEREVFAVFDEIVQQAGKEEDFLKSRPRDQILRMLFVTLYSGVTCLKHEGFKEEREWRAVHHPQIGRSDSMKLSIESIGGIPQHVWKMPLDRADDPNLADMALENLLEGVIIGPSQYPWVLAQAFGDELVKLGISRYAVRASEIPIRT